MMKIKELKNYLKHPEAFIPEKISNKMVCGVIDGLLKIPTRKKIIAANAEHNRKVLENATFFTKGAFIENQSYKGTDEMPGWGNVCYSNGSIKRKGNTYRSSMNFSGCEVMACYNALLVLEGADVDLVSIISYFEKDGVVARGLLGTSPYAIRRFFQSRGYDVKATTEREPEALNQLLRDSDVMIITVYNQGHDIRRKIHTMCVTIDRDINGGISSIQLHNSNGRCPVTYKDMDDLLAKYSGGGASMIYAIGINKKKPELSVGEKEEHF